LGDGGMKRMEKTFIRIHQDFEIYQMAFKMAVATRSEIPLILKMRLWAPYLPISPSPHHSTFFIRIGARR
jgi:hypothetical protein